MIPCLYHWSYFRRVLDATVHNESTTALQVRDIFRNLENGKQVDVDKYGNLILVSVSTSYHMMYVIFADNC